MKCNYCERVCDIPEDKNGYCTMYRNLQGTITENYPDAFLNIYPVSSESIPMLHFYPNSVFLLISTIGCNFACVGCISEFQTTRPGTLHEVLTPHTPEEILAIARESNCRGITFCLNEPTVSFPTFLRVVQAAKNEGFLVGCSTNGYMTGDTLDRLIPYLDFVNIGLKGCSDERYLECGVPSGDPVFRNIKTLYDAGVFIEVSVMYILGKEEEVIGAAKRIQVISPAIPFQVMRFVGTTDTLTELEPNREEGEDLCTTLHKFLDHVYLFNTPATTHLDSRCPVCGAIIIHRVFFGPMAARVLSCQSNGICSCGYTFKSRGEVAPIPKDGSQILGGYRSIMGVKFIVSFLNILGVTDDHEIDRLCNTVITTGYLRFLQDQKDSIDTFIGMTRYVATLAGREEKAECIINVVMSVITDIEGKTEGIEKPRVYTVFCHPLSPVYAEKFANTLVEMAGGRSLNKEQDFKESVNAEYTIEALNRLDPDVILVSGPFSPSVDDFLITCGELGIICRAISENRVYVLNRANTTGTLGWIIGLMDVANLIHPEIFQFSLDYEKARLDTAISGFQGDDDGRDRIR
ncbi:MAG TPA: radical SAM protein [Methanospirillum sp.]|nr:radical SAM protein [Methanospirillum sp.]